MDLMTRVPRKDQDQPMHQYSLIRAFVIRLQRFRFLNIYYAASKDSDQTALICKMNWVCTGCLGVKSYIISVAAHHYFNKPI